MARSTADCKVFLVDFFSRNPQIMAALFDGDSAGAQAEVTKVKNWKRLWKVSASKCDYYQGCYTIFKDGRPVNRFCEGQEERPDSDFVTARGFDCSPAEGQIAFIVLEAANGTLSLADYIGD